MAFASGIRKKPWILVWDLDETIVTGWKHGWTPEDISINPKAALIISTALKLRITGIVRYIFLLTNNSDEPYINAAIKKLGQFMNYTGKIFNDRLINDPAVRTSIVSKVPENPDKGLRDVDFLLKRMKSPNNHTAYRILFFDDHPGHVLKTELPREHYIQVTSFRKRNELFDSTPWERAMSLLKGRSIIMKTRKRKSRSARRTRRLNR